MYVGFSFLPPAYPTWVDRIPRGKRINRFSEHQKQPIPNITFSDLSGNGGYLFLYIFQKQNTFIISSVLSTPGPLYPPRKSDSNPMVNLEAALKNSPPQTPRSPMFPRILFLGFILKNKTETEAGKKTQTASWDGWRRDTKFYTASRFFFEENTELKRVLLFSTHNGLMGDLCFFRSFM